MVTKTAASENRPGRVVLDVEDRGRDGQHDEERHGDQQAAPEEPDVEAAGLGEDSDDGHAETACRPRAFSRSNTSGSEPAVARQAPGTL